MNRRGLFGWLAGACALPIVKPAVAAAAPEAQMWGDKIKVTDGPSVLFIRDRLDRWERLTEEQYAVRLGCLYEPIP